MPASDSPHAFTLGCRRRRCGRVFSSLGHGFFRVVYQRYKPDSSLFKIY